MGDSLTEPGSWGGSTSVDCQILKVTSHSTWQQESDNCNYFTFRGEFISLGFNWKFFCEAVRFASLRPVVLSQTLPLRGSSIAYAAVSIEQAQSISSGNQWLCHKWLLDSVYFVRIDLLSGLENELKMMKSTGQARLRVLHDAGAPLNPAQCLTLYEMNLCTDSELYLYLSFPLSLSSSVH